MKDALFRFEKIARRAVLLLDRFQLLGCPLPEKILELRIEVVPVAESGVGGAPFVQDLQRRPVAHRVHQLVLVDVFTESFDGSLRTMVLGDQRRTGKSDPGCIRKRLD